MITRWLLHEKAATQITRTKCTFYVDIRPFSLPLPHLAEQVRMVPEVEWRLSVVEELEAVVNTNLQWAVRLRQSIFQKAFTGQLA